MKKIIFIIFFIILIIGGYFTLDWYDFAAGVNEDAKTGQYIRWNLSDIKDGDIIFQTSKSSQSKAIQIATNSKYSHMGIIYIKDDNYYVFEALQPVKLTPLKEWILRGLNSHFIVKRLKERDNFLTKETLSKMYQTGEYFKGKAYDLFFSWSDEQIYCSELVWKIYKSIDIEVCNLQRMRDFNLSSNEVNKKLNERYGENIPLDEIVVSPSAIFNSDLLETVVTN